MANLKNVIYLTNEDYETLVTTGTVTIDGETLIYDENNVYVTPEKLASQTEDGLMSAEDKVKLDSIMPNELVTQADLTADQVELKFPWEFNLGSVVCKYDDDATKYEGYTAFTGSDGQTYYLQAVITEVPYEYNGNVYIDSDGQGEMITVNGGTFTINQPTSTTVAKEIAYLKSIALPIAPSISVGDSILEILEKINGGPLPTFNTFTWAGFLIFESSWLFVSVKDEYYGSHNFSFKYINLNRHTLYSYEGSGVDENGYEIDFGSMWYGGQREILTEESEALNTLLDTKADVTYVDTAISNISSGTKLYKHTITTPVAGETIVIINNQKEAYTELLQLQALDLNACVATYVSKNGTSEVVLSKAIGSPTYAGQTISLDVTTFTDTPSEL